MKLPQKTYLATSRWSVYIQKRFPYANSPSSYAYFHCFLQHFQKIGMAFLPFPVTVKALPITTEATPDAQPKAKAAPGPSPQVNSVPQAVVQKESLLGPSRLLSPYPNVSSSISFMTCPVSRARLWGGFQVRLVSGDCWACIWYSLRIRSPLWI